MNTITSESFNFKWMLIVYYITELIAFLPINRYKPPRTLNPVK